MVCLHVDDSIVIIVTNVASYMQRSREAQVVVCLPQGSSKNHLPYAIWQLKRMVWTRSIERKKTTFKLLVFKASLSDFPLNKYLLSYVSVLFHKEISLYKHGPRHGLLLLKVWPVSIK